MDVSLPKKTCFRFYDPSFNINHSMRPAEDWRLKCQAALGVKCSAPKRWCWPQMFCENNQIWRAYVPGSQLPILGMVFPPLIRNSYNGYINPYYWVDDHPLIPVYFYTPGSTRMGFAGTLDNLKMYFLGQFNLIEGNTWCICLRCSILFVPVKIAMKQHFLNYFQHCFFLANRSQEGDCNQPQTLDCMVV